MTDKCPCQIVYGPGSDNYGRDRDKHQKAIKDLLKLFKKKKKFVEELKK